MHLGYQTSLPRAMLAAAAGRCVDQCFCLPLLALRQAGEPWCVQQAQPGRTWCSQTFGWDSSHCSAGLAPWMVLWAGQGEGWILWGWRRLWAPQAGCRCWRVVFLVVGGCCDTLYSLPKTPKRGFGISSCSSQMSGLCKTPVASLHWPCPFRSAPQQDRSTMAFKLPQFGSGKASTAAKKPAARTAAKPATVKKSGTVSTGTRKGGVGYRQAHGSNSASSRWMGSLPGQPD